MVRSGGICDVYCWTKEECVEKISFADNFPVDIGQEEVMDYIQTENVKKVYEYLIGKRELA